MMPGILEMLERVAKGKGCVPAVERGLGLVGAAAAAAAAAVAAAVAAGTQGPSLQAASRL